MAASFQELQAGFEEWWNDCGGSYIQPPSERNLVRDYARAAYRAGKMAALVGQPEAPESRSGERGEVGGEG